MPKLKNLVFEFNFIVFKQNKRLNKVTKCYIYNDVY